MALPQRRDGLQLLNPQADQPAACPYRLEGFELASGLVTGTVAGVPRLEAGAVGPGAARPGAAVRQGLDEVLLEALRRPPVVIAFSGGRDSSGLLALAVDLARRHGLELPVPATHVFPGDLASDERSWQEEVVRSLGLADWQRCSWADELDLVGPFAQQVLRQHGPVYPMNAHFLLPLFELAGGGTLVTGTGGDELFGLWSKWSLARHAIWCQRSELARLAAVAAPARLRRGVLRATAPSVPWLDRSGRQEARRRLAEAQVEVPWRWSDLVMDRWWRSRRRLATEQTLTALASSYDVALSAPFMSASVLRAAAAAHPWAGFASRAQGMQEVFAGLLAPQVLNRSTKARFNSCFFAAYSRDFVRRWDGRGVGDLPVDLGALRSTWQAEVVDARSFSLLQGVWYRAQEPGGARVAGATEAARQGREP